MQHYPRILYFLLATLLLAAACAASETTRPAPNAADLVLRNGQVYTVNTAQPWAESVAVKDGRFVFVGADADVASWIGKQTRVQDLHGGFLLPGFVDAHSHILLGGAHIEDLVLNPTDDLETWLAEIAQFSAAHPEREILTGSGFLASRFGGEGPHKSLLDAISTERPIFILDEGMHGAWLNSAALRRLNITASTPDPHPGFDYYKRDAQGIPTGYLLEGTIWQAIEALQLTSVDSIAAGTARVIEEYNRYGITAVFDAGPWEAEDTQVAILQKLDAAGDLTIHFGGSQYIDDAAELGDIVAEVLALKSGTADTPYPIATLKIMVDGTVEGLTAAMFEDYQGDPDNRGETVLSATALNKLVSEAVAQNLDIHFHALGERAIAMALDAIELAQADYPGTKVRFTISHIQVMRDADVQRFARLGVIAQGSLLWAAYDDAARPLLSEDQFNRFYRYQSLLEAGVRLTFGCDFPSNGGGLSTVAPLYNIEVGHTRQAAGDAAGPVQPRASERLGIASLIEGYTLNGAYQMRLENEIGTIEVGKQADLVLLDKNLFEVEPHQIHEVDVLTTWLAGKPVYEAPNHR